MIPVKGYSVYVKKDLGDFGVVLLNRKNVVIPKEHGWCLMAAFMDFEGDDPKPNPKRVTDVMKLIEIQFGKKVETKPVWCGMRAVTPDELPLIGRLQKYDNLYVATGASMRGFCLSFGIAQMLS